MTAPRLQMVDINKHFSGVQALKDVSIEAHAGEALALIGANGAGKSTLMNVLGGVIVPDSGEIYLDGQPVAIRAPLDSMHAGIAFVHQEMAMLPTMTVAENLFITTFPGQRGLIDRRTMHREAAKVLERLGCQFDPSTPVYLLGAGDQQMVEIARALLTSPRIIIFDEPTSSLTSREKDRLFEVMQSLKQDDVATIFITHFLDETFRICDRAVILRNGMVVGEDAITNLTYDHVVELMIGSADWQAEAAHAAHAVGDPVLIVENLSREGVLTDVSFQLNRGEVLGLWGLLGAGRTELARAIVGLDPIDHGALQIEIDGELRSVRPSQAQKWIGLITENRRSDGLLLPMPVAQNISLASLPKLVRFWPFLNASQEREMAQQHVDRMQVVVADLEQPVETLSGGNQQKVIVSRWLELQPPIYIMDEPTRGLDVSAKAEIRSIILELAAQGASILLVSSDIDEIMTLSDRFIVLDRGALVKTLPRGAAKAELMAAAAGATLNE
ncbi:MAG: sugar ABC transporter ATP-binding protein [Chloroflexi bacterium]|nr:sugar ABC transporter ATP-binding protein [Chloroflexota bacterium]